MTAAHSLLVRAARGEVVERPPVWAMRQAGRWDPEFQRLREGLSFYEFSDNVELAAKASLAPRRFGVDAIILFYDITTLTVAMGLPFTLQPERGPVPHNPIRTLADVEVPEAGRLRKLVLDAVLGIDRDPGTAAGGKPAIDGELPVGIRDRRKLRAQRDRSADAESDDRGPGAGFAVGIGLGPD